MREVKICVVNYTNYALGGMLLVLICFLAECVNIDVIYQVDKNPDESSWKIEQNGRVVCSQIKPTVDRGSRIQTTCCIAFDQKYTLICTDLGGDGFDYIGYDQEYDGFIEIDNQKYCDNFNVLEIIDFDRNYNSFNRSNYELAFLLLFFIFL